VWREYCENFLDWYITNNGHADYAVDQVLNLRNLVKYLYEHPSWGEKECKDKARSTLTEMCVVSEHDMSLNCSYCDGRGRITHPALKYLRSIKEVKDGQG